MSGGNQTLLFNRFLPTITKNWSGCCREEAMLPEDYEEVDLNVYDPDSERRQHSHAGYDDDDEGHGGHGPGVSCATQ